MPESDEIDPSEYLGAVPSISGAGNPIVKTRSPTRPERSRARGRKPVGCFFDVEHGEVRGRGIHYDRRDHLTILRSPDADLRRILDDMVCREGEPLGETKKHDPSEDAATALEGVG
jgi:hypothetical protein